MLCRICHTAPAADPDCKECREREGVCLMCLKCRYGWYRQTLAGVLGVLRADENDSDMLDQMLRGLSKCTLRYMVWMDAAALITLFPDSGARADAA
jgi:hypothetical protein